MIYSAPSPESPIDQADIIDGCPLIFITEFDLSDPARSEVEYVPTRLRETTVKKVG
jgi:hypothetical protein